MRLRSLVASAVLAVCCAASPALAQSQANSGSIEGTVKDSTGGVLPGVTVTITNTDTGARRVVVTNDGGLFRAPLLPLGAYTVAFELSGFTRLERTSVSLSAGQAIVLNETMGVGNMQETVRVTADADLVEAGRIDLGRNINEREIKNLPNVSRNPYNYALQQPGVTGFENTEFGVPRFSANGALLRVNYQVDGNTNTQKDRAGLRLMPMSEVMIREVKVVTSGYAPEFGQSAGLVYNAITPSGTNQIHGDVSYRFRRKGFSAFPFFFALPKTDANKPNDKVDTVTATVGGPIRKDRLHYYAGYERTYRDMPRVITLSPEIAQQVGVVAQPGAVPANQSVNFFIGKVDFQANAANRLTIRSNIFRNWNPYNAGGGGTTALERSVDFKDAMFSHAGQIVTTLGSSRLNELRLQYAQRHQQRNRRADSATGPAINISGAISFGGPTGDGEDFVQDIYQVIDNFTWLSGAHNYKAGIDVQWVADHRAVPLAATFTFATVNDYLAARAGTSPRSWTGFTQTIGVPTFDMDNSLVSTFVQDDWKITPDFKLLYGIRYDLYRYPAGIADAPFQLSQSFNRDTNNLAPRVGMAWTFGPERRMVLRASSGIMYDQPLLAILEQAYANDGNPKRVSVSLTPTSSGAPNFPTTLADLPNGFSIALANRTIFAPAADFVTGYNWQNSIQLERALGDKYTASIGVIYNRGYKLPVINDTNLINPTSFLADGRPVFSSAVNANTRLDPRFNRINVVESIGDSTYKALTLGFGQRWSGGVQYDLNYTFGKGTDNAVMTGTLAVQGDDGRSDPTNLERDRGPNALDTRHTFNGSIVANPSVTLKNKVLNAIANDNQVGVILQFNSGLPFTIRSNRNLNGDGTNNDRPLNIGRNSIYLPERWNVDLRYSRFVPLRGAQRVEVLAEFKNIFNIEQTAGVNRTVDVDTLGNPLAPIPTSGSGFTPTSGYEQRKFQLGFKYYF